MKLDEARRITGRHLVIDGPGAVADVAHTEVARIVDRLRLGLAHLGWAVAPVVRPHRQATTLGFRAEPDLLDAAVDLLDWAIGTDDQAELERVERTARRREDLQLRALLAAFPGLAFEGEDLVTVGLGVHGRSYPRDEAPHPAKVGPVGGIPMVLITGTNGKTTTTRLIAHLAACAGYRVGNTSSDGVVIGGDFVERGDWTGPGATRRVLRDARVEFAVLETARGGILRRGIALDGAAAAVVTNVTPEHLGEWGIDDLHAMARAKLVLAYALRRGGTLVIPAVSEPIYAVLPEVLARRPDLVVRTFASAPPRPGQRVPDGWADDRYLHFGETLVPLHEIPITFGGTARHNVENALCATLVALSVNLPGHAISRGLRTFRPSVADNPGRMNTYRLPSGAVAVIDFAHNADGLRRITQTVRAWPQARRTLLLGQAGDRPDEDLRAFALEAGPLAPARVILKDVTKRLYGRQPGDVPRILFAGLLEAGIPRDRIEGPTHDEATGVRRAIAGATRDDVIVLLLHETLAVAVAILTEAGAVPVDP